MASVEARPLQRDRSSVEPAPITSATVDQVFTEPAGDRRGQSGGEDEAGPALTGDQPRESALTPYLPERWRGARVDPGSRGMIALCGVGAVVVVLAAWVVFRDAPVLAPVPALPVVAPLPVGSSNSVESLEPLSSEPLSSEPLSSEPLSSEPLSSDSPEFVVVSVVGLVLSSGLVHLPPDSRIADAIAAAGGPLIGADMVALNLAAKVHDGDQIVVGALPPEGRPTVSAMMKDDGSAGQGGSGATPVEESGGLVNLNSATVAELDTLSGVGPVTAASIIAWRESNGPFTDVGQLAEVDGIGPVRLEKLRTQVTV